jgi:hypothetical protein
MPEGLRRVILPALCAVFAGAAVEAADPPIDRLQLPPG